MSTPFHAKYWAHALQRRLPSDSLGKLGPSLLNATVDLNPHQIEAALFAFRSPLSRGAILADEVGLGKTIEASLIMSQLWAEGRRRILVITPTTLRTQWAQELAEKFFLPSTIVDTKALRELDRSGLDTPLAQGKSIVICSYHFARAQGAPIKAVDWDLVVVDEAHRLRNVYKTGNKIARVIKDSIQRHPKVLLTATPLQNSLLELYGLVGFVDEHVFGSLASFRHRYASEPLDDEHFADLKRRLAPVCNRTLRRQVHVRYTRRIALTQDFTPTDEEQRLYDGVSAYLLRKQLHALPASQRTLMTLVLRKLLASSTFAIADTLQALLDRLRGLSHSAASPAPKLEDDFEALPEMEEEWADEEPGLPPVSEHLPERPAEIEAEIAELANQKDLATSITKNAKGQALVLALREGFDRLATIGANRKALVFTESRRTQEYLVRLLEESGYQGQVMTLNGTNTDARSTAIYRAWKERQADRDSIRGDSKAVHLRTALVEQFRDQSAIMVATEAGAEGVNLQFCSLVVNYDLPWNPQRIEQRIGRCHRYGQTHDVVVINFLNRRNAADQRVFQLLAVKLQLFDGVFGTSDEVLGLLSGVDFERRIAEIYSSARTPAEIEAAFNALEETLKPSITAAMASTRAQLLENFDEDVHERLRINGKEAEHQLDRLSQCFWKLTSYELASVAAFDHPSFEFTLRSAPAQAPHAELGVYRLLGKGAASEGAHSYRLGHPLAQALIDHAARSTTFPAEVTFDASRQRPRVGLVERLRGRSGYLAVMRVTIRSLDAEDHLLASGRDDSGWALDQESCEKLFSVDGRLVGPVVVPRTVTEELAVDLDAARGRLAAEITHRNAEFLDSEIAKLESWADDLRVELDQELKEIEGEIRTLKRDARLQGTLEAKLALQRRIKELEAKRSKKRNDRDAAQDVIDRRKDELLDVVESRLKQSVDFRILFTIRWRVG